MVCACLPLRRGCNIFILGRVALFLLVSERACASVERFLVLSHDPDHSLLTHLPMQKSRKMTSSSSSTSIRPEIRPSSFAAMRISSAAKSSGADSPSAAYSSNAASAPTVFLRCSRWRARVMSAASPSVAP